jgi:hypothetical protein
VGYTHFNDLEIFFYTCSSYKYNKDGSPYIIAGHEPFSINNKLDQKVLQITDNLNIVRGNHTLLLVLLKISFSKNSFNLKGMVF